MTDSATTTEESAELPSHRCGRCRAILPPDPTLHELGTPVWRMCEPCRILVLDSKIPRG